MAKLAWHFTNGMRLRDGQELIEGKTYVHAGPVRMCESGLHYSVEPLDALRYAPGLTLSRVEVDEIVEEEGDKGVCRKRRVIKILDVTKIVVEWACDVAEHAVKRYCTGSSAAPQHAIDTARALLRGEATAADCSAAAQAAYAVHTGAYVAYAARAAARAADQAARAAVRAASDAAYAAHTAAHAADQAACTAARAAADQAARAAADQAARAAYRVAYQAVHAAARAAANRLLRIRLKRAFGEM